METCANNPRVRDIFAHIGIAVCLRRAAQTIADVYGCQINLQLPLPPYPGNLIHVPQIKVN